MAAGLKLNLYMRHERQIVCNSGIQRSMSRYERLFALALVLYTNYTSPSYLNVGLSKRLLLNKKIKIVI